MKLNHILTLEVEFNEIEHSEMSLIKFVMCDPVPRFPGYI